MPSAKKATQICRDLLSRSQNRLCHEFLCLLIRLRWARPHGDLGGQMLILDSDIDGVVCRVPEILHFVLEWWKPAGIARFGKNFLRFAIFIGKPEMPGGENDDHASHMRMQA